MNTGIRPAICCIGYNRPHSMRRLLESVVHASYDDNDITLVVSIDESPESDKVEAVAKEIEWNYGEKKILRYPHRLGLKEHCLRCGDLSLEYGAVIFLEDDVVVAPGYYKYTKAAISKYKDEEKIFGISLYFDNWLSPLSVDFKPAFNGNDVFWAMMEESHGQCWMKKGWEEFRKWLETNQNLSVYNKNVIPCVYEWNPMTSWSRFVYYFMAEKQKYYVLPYHSYATNMSEVGIHAAVTTDICQTALSEDVLNTYRFSGLEDSVVYDAFAERMDHFVDSVAGVEIDKICIDLNGYKYDWEGYEYILTTKSLPYEIVCTFGINMEPIENNVRYNVPGDAIRLYKIPVDYKSNKAVSSILPYKMSPQRLAHIYNRVPFKYLLYVITLKIKNRMTFLFKKLFTDYLN